MYEQGINKSKQNKNTRSVHMNKLVKATKIKRRATDN